MTSNAHTALLLVLTLTLSACATNRTLLYDPVPAEIALEQDGHGAPIGYVYASIDEAVREGPDWAIRVRLRLDNRTSAPLTLRVNDMRLLDGDLTELTLPRIIPAPPRDLGKGGSWTGTVDFPLPPGRGPGHLDLDGLNLHLALDSGDQPAPIPVSIPFRRVIPPVYEEPYGGHVSIGVHHGY